jgi:2-amino-4-hydroxy-6-hydroxymethyldihydropteridine diphosphokinase
MATCLVGLGSNLGDRRRTIDEAIALLDQHSLIQVTARSLCYESKPIGGPPVQGSYLNSAVRLDTALPAIKLLRFLLETESQLGRTRGQRWSARTIDLDLLLYELATAHSRELTLPHPRIGFRRFVLEPAAEIAADMPIASTGWTVGQLLQHLKAQPNLVEIVSDPKPLATEMASRVVSALNGQFGLRSRFLNDPITQDEIEQLENDTTGLDTDAEIEFLRHSETWFVSDYRPFSPMTRKSKMLILLSHSTNVASDFSLSDVPTLVVSMDDKDAALDEITAAILAMHHEPKLA